ncbi:hypothetical protein ACH4ZU_25090 [Streptomyces sp. NPDC020472]|uniref:hypothetical protein n=1 Tax=Streptomyces sp. NPDC020472 TaxID=3365075 RepID=UPI0037BD3C3A
MSGDPQQTPGALLARLEVRERQIAVEAEAAHEQIAQLTALLDGLAQAAEHITITRKALLELPDETAPAPATPTPALPDGPAYQRIMAVFAEAGTPLRARNPGRDRARTVRQAATATARTSSLRGPAGLRPVGALTGSCAPLRAAGMNRKS